MKLKNRLDYKRRRHNRLRQKVRGSAGRPRMSVCISNRHIYIQFIDDETGSTLASFSTAGLKNESKLNVAAAEAAGRKAAEMAAGKGIKQAVFDRGGLAYAGRIKAIAEAARKTGIRL
ncbi:MAG: 50S ribosomal protein L18 [Kiritimatiellae bacterium]|nr:50S ribosomal protein L18 [Kiritimatiellia bacterium]